MNAFSHRIFLVGLSLLLGSFLLLSGCGSDQATGEQAPRNQQHPRVETLLLEPQQFDHVIEVNGSVEALDDAALSAQASGPLVMVKELGTWVEAGETVAQINPREARAAVEQAEAQLESARAQYELAQDTYERQEPLYRDSIISASEFENVRSQRAQALANLNQAKASLSQAEEQLANTRVTTPFAGTIEERLMKPGEQVSPGTQVVRVVNTQRVRVQADVPERYVNDLDEGSTVRVRIRSASLEDRTGRVVFVGNTINETSRTFPIEVEIDNEDGRLKPEMIAKLFITREQIDDALVVPRSAISRDEEGLDTYTVTRQDSLGVVQNHPITLGPASGNRAVVRSGLSAGDELVIVGQTDISEGDTVHVTQRYRSIDEAQASETPLAPAESADSLPAPEPQDRLQPSETPEDS